MRLSPALISIWQIEFCLNSNSVQDTTLVENKVPIQTKIKEI